MVSSLSYNGYMSGGVVKNPTLRRECDQAVVLISANRTHMWSFMTQIVRSSDDCKHPVEQVSNER